MVHDDVHDDLRLLLERRRNFMKSTIANVSTVPFRSIRQSRVTRDAFTWLLTPDLIFFLDLSEFFFKKKKIQVTAELIEMVQYTGLGRQGDSTVTISVPWFRSIRQLRVTPTTFDSAGGFNLLFSIYPKLESLNKSITGAPFWGGWHVSVVNYIPTTKSYYKNDHFDGEDTRLLTRTWMINIVSADGKINLKKCSITGMSLRLLIFYW